MGGYHPVTLSGKYKLTKDYQELIKQMQNVINMFTASLYTYLVDVNISWTHILPYYIMPLYWKGPFFLTKHLNLGVLIVSLLSVPQVCLHNQVSMEPCTGERGNTKQNKIQNWPKEPGNCTWPWFGWEIIKNQKSMATL